MFGFFRFDFQNFKDLQIFSLFGQVCYLKNVALTNRAIFAVDLSHFCLHVSIGPLLWSDVFIVLWSLHHPTFLFFIKE